MSEVKMHARRRLAAAVAAGCLVASFGAATQAAVTINEFAYDDTKTSDPGDSHEFVELYNDGGAAVDISGWTLGGRDASGNNTIITIPGALGSSTTTIAPGGFYVIGMAGVQNVNQTNAAFLENDAETIELRSGPFASATLVDAVVYESNKGTASYGALPADVATQVGGGTASPGYWGNHQTVEYTGTPLTGTVSVGRYLDGGDTNSNGRDFGMRPFTPGASNLGGGSVTSFYTPPDVDAAASQSVVPGLRASFEGGAGQAYTPPSGARVIDPTVISTFNPHVIPASPDGGNVITVHDSSGGGEAAVSLDVHNGNGGFNIDAYLDTTDLPTGATNHESTIFGTMGNVGALFNTPDPEGDIFADVPPGNASDATGIGWLFQKFQGRAILYLVDAGDGGNSSPDAGAAAMEWEILHEVDLSNSASAWHQLAIQVNADGTGFGVLDGVLIPFTTDPSLVGSFYVGYRENLAGSPGTPTAGITYRPPTFDVSTSPVPEPAGLALLGVGAGLLMRRRRAM